MNDAQTIAPAIAPVIRSYEATVDDVDLGERSVVSKVGTGCIDRYRTCIPPTGIDLTAFRANPVVLWEHGKDPKRGTMPVGRNIWTKVNRSGRGQLLGKTQFRTDDYSQMLWEAVRDGDIRGWSVRVLPRVVSPPTREEIRAWPELGEGCDLIYRTTELLEYSLVAVMGNPETLTILASRGIWLPEEARVMTETGNGADLVKPTTKGKKAKGKAHCAMGGKRDGDEMPDDDEEDRGGITISTGSTQQVEDSMDPEDVNNADEASDEDEDPKRKKKKKKPDQTARYIDSDGQSWTIHEPDGRRVIAVRDAKLADEILRSMDEPPRHFHEAYKSEMGETRAEMSRIEANVMATIDLLFLGKV